MFAAYIAYTDHEIGRVIETVEDMGKLDNTLMIYISGDNGTSAEGSHGRHRLRSCGAQGIDVPVEDQLKFYDVWGGPMTTPHMSVAWAWAFDTPFKWTKQVASYFGGTRQGMVMAWPGHITDKGGVRSQFHHLIDIVPTILEVTGIQAPKMVNGIAQKPIEGVSMAYTLRQGECQGRAVARARPSISRCWAIAPSTTMAGWPRRRRPRPWALGQGTLPNVVDGSNGNFTTSTEDFSQDNDLAATMPDKLHEMQELFLVEAAKYRCFR